MQVWHSFFEPTLSLSWIFWISCNFEFLGPTASSTAATATTAATTSPRSRPRPGRSFWIRQYHGLISWPRFWQLLIRNTTTYHALSILPNTYLVGIIKQKTSVWRWFIKQQWRREERKKINNVDDDIVKLAFLRLSWHQFEWSELYIKNSSIFNSSRILVKSMRSKKTIHSRFIQA